MVMNLGWRYDLIVKLTNILVFRGKLGRLLDRALDLAQLRSGESVLDVGCGTGTLALKARERVGSDGLVVGIDPGIRQIEWARTKAEQRRVEVEFQVAGIERLGYRDGAFNVVFSTMMMHHLPDDLKRIGLGEIARVLAPNGRLVVVDFKRPDRNGKRFGAGMLGIQDLPDLMQGAGFSGVEHGDIHLPRFPGVHGAGFAVGHVT
jgi:ubiquinone/menaquinone biosynthesis C-methylase UbiE